MASKYTSYFDLRRHETAGRDYRIVSIERPGARVLVVAPHGGMIEAGTSELAAAIAGDEYSLFCFEGLKPYGENRDLHITSHLFDHPDCLALAASHDSVLSVHGCRGQESLIYVGGLDGALMQRLSGELALGGFEADCSGTVYPGRHPQNICNRGLRGAGAQLEIPYGLRRPQFLGAISRAARAALCEPAA